jgi:hypothetical protein
MRLAPADENPRRLPTDPRFRRMVLPISFF